MRIEYEGWELGRIEGSIFVADRKEIALFDTWNAAMQWVDRHGKGGLYREEEREVEDRKG